MVKNAKPRYSAKEKKAFYMGVGASIGLGKAGEVKRRASNMSPEEKQSFYNGLDAGMATPTRKKRK